MAGNGVADENGVQVLANGVVNGNNVHVVRARKLRRKQLTRAVLKGRQKIIRAGVRYKFKQALIIWCPFRQIRPDIVLRACSSVDRKVKIRNRWIPDEDPIRKVWGGAMAIFKTELKAQLAYIRFKECFTDLCLLPLNRLVHLLTKAEIHYRKFGKPTIRIQISGKKSFINKNNDLEKELHLIGEVEKICYLGHVKEYGIICEVDYKYVAHALVAKTVINGKFFRRQGFLSVELVDTKKVKHIIKQCTNAISNWLKTTHIQEY